MKFYCEDKETVLHELNSSADGLTSAEAAKRLEENGKNKLAEGKKESLFHRFLKQLAEPMTIILLVAAAISAGGLFFVLSKKTFKKCKKIFNKKHLFRSFEIK